MPWQSHYEGESAEAETQVRQLATDLKNIDSAMVAVLTPEKYRYEVVMWKSHDQVDTWLYVYCVYTAEAKYMYMYT